MCTCVSIHMHICGMSLCICVCMHACAHLGHLFSELFKFWALFPLLILRLAHKSGSSFGILWGLVLAVSLAKWERCKEIPSPFFHPCCQPHAQSFHMRHQALSLALTRSWRAQQGTDSLYVPPSATSDTPPHFSSLKNPGGYFLPIITHFSSGNLTPNFF